jgi:hypothetical protein
MAGFQRAPERRQFGRRQTSFHAIITVRGRPPVRCLVSDISDGGAYLQLDEAGWLPSRFHLDIEATGLAAECEVMHRTAGGVGVRFA